jgi:hypothetical protein
MKKLLGLKMSSKRHGDVSTRRVKKSLTEFQHDKQALAPFVGWHTE